MMTVKELKDELDNYGDHLQVWMETDEKPYPIDSVDSQEMYTGEIFVMLINSDGEYKQ